MMLLPYVGILSGCAPESFEHSTCMRTGDPGLKNLDISQLSLSLQQTKYLYRGYH